MNYPRSEKYLTDDLMSKIMGPNPIKLEEELLTNHQIPKDATVCDLGSGQGLTSVFLVKEYGFKVIAADLWSDPEENRKFFRKMGLTDEQIVPVKADAEALPFIKNGGYIYIAVPGMKKDCHDALPKELLLSWTPEQLEYLHDAAYWQSIVSRCSGAEIITVEEMESNENVWADWLEQENEYAVGDRKAMEAGGGKYLNFIKIVMRKKN